MLGQWSNSLTSENDEDFFYYTYIVFGASFVFSFFILLRIISNIIFSLRASRKIHQKMIQRVLRAPINLYFDVTPIGRILNRFSKDMAVLDTSIFFTISFVYISLIQTISSLVVSSLAVYWIVIPFPIVFILYWKLYTFSINSQSQSERLCSLTKSPILSNFSETINGVSTIRCFDKSEEFISRNYEILNKNVLTN